MSNSAMSLNEPLIYLVTCDEHQAGELSAQLALFGFKVHVFSRQNALLAALHTAAPLAVLIDESGLGDAPLDQAVPLVKRLAKGPLLYLAEPLSVVRQLEMMRCGVTDLIAKPYDVQQLIDRLDHMIEQGHESPFRVLVIDDSESVSKWTSAILGDAGMQVRTLGNPLDVFLSLERFKPDIILMDVYMPQCTGDEIARVIRQNAHFDSIPIVFLSTETSRGRQLMARSMGGDDFLVKSTDAEELVAAVTITAERYRRLRHSMTCDSLTGLLNHTHLTEQLEHAVQHAQRERLQLAFAMIDIDHFKQINDNHGHSSGDRVLKNLSRLMRQSVRSQDSVGRYGGEEFAVIFDDTSLLRAAQQLDTLRARFESLDMECGDQVLRATFSAGVARLEPGMTAGRLIDAADEALYLAKKAGRNQISIARSVAGR